jgi:hypothetical protein
MHPFVRGEVMFPVLFGLCPLGSGPPTPQASTVVQVRNTGDGLGGFDGALDDEDHFGTGCAAIGDLNGDCFGDLAVAAPGDDDGGPRRGATWLLFMQNDGEVGKTSKISSTSGNFGGPLEDYDSFGSPAGLGDLDGDGVVDIAAGAFGDDDGSTGIFGRGAVWILFLRPDGTVKSHQKISDTQGGFTGDLDDGDLFGGSLACVGDLDRDGVQDLAVSATGDDDGAVGERNRGAVWVLFLNPSGTVKSHQKISATQGGFTGILNGNDQLGLSLGFLGDLDADGFPELAAGALDVGLGATGAVFLLSLNPDGTVLRHVKIGYMQGGFTGGVHQEDLFGGATVCPGDLDGDGFPDMVVGATKDDQGGFDRGALWELFLRPDGSVRSHRRLEAVRHRLEDEDHFGVSLATLDLDLDGDQDLIVGASGDHGLGFDRGAIWELYLDESKARWNGRSAAGGVTVTLPLVPAAGPRPVLRLEPTAPVPPWAVPVVVLEPSGRPSVLDSFAGRRLVVGPPCQGLPSELAIPCAGALQGRTLHARGIYLLRGRPPVAANLTLVLACR